MTQAELFAHLKTAGYPVAYHHFTAAQVLPYLIYLRAFDSNISSDAKVHGKYKNYNVELYTAKKDLTAEQKLEAVLNTIDTEYETSETYIESEALYQVVYQIKVTEKF
jgi:hypothetical protein